ncbi:MAG: hypothetical protein ABI076_02290 [Acidobacteriaceae bacterium]
MRDTGRDPFYKLFIPKPGAGDGFEDGEPAGIGCDLAVADDQSDGFSLRDVTEGSLDRCNLLYMCRNMNFEHESAVTSPASCRRS